MISLRAAVVNSACKVWPGDRQFAGDVTPELADLFAGRVSSRFDQRKIGRFFDDGTGTVARRLVTLLAVAFGAVPSYEREAAALASCTPAACLAAWRLNSYPRSGPARQTLDDHDVPQHR